MMGLFHKHHSLVILMVVGHLAILTTCLPSSSLEVDIYEQNSNENSEEFDDENGLFSNSPNVDVTVNFDHDFPSHISLDFVDDKEYSEDDYDILDDGDDDEASYHDYEVQGDFDESYVGKDENIQSENESDRYEESEEEGSYDIVDKDRSEDQPSFDHHRQHNNRHGDLYHHNNHDDYPFNRYPRRIHQDYGYYPSHLNSEPHHLGHQRPHHTVHRNDDYSSGESFDEPLKTDLSQESKNASEESEEGEDIVESESNEKESSDEGEVEEVEESADDAGLKSDNASEFTEGSSTHSDSKSAADGLSSKEPVTDHPTYTVVQTELESTNATNKEKGEGPVENETVGKEVAVAIAEDQRAQNPLSHLFHHGHHGHHHGHFGHGHHHHLHGHGHHHHGYGHHGHHHHGGHGHHHHHHGYGHHGHHHHHGGHRHHHHGHGHHHHGHGHHHGHHGHHGPHGHHHGHHHRYF